MILLYLGPSFGTIEQGQGGSDFRWGIKLYSYDDGWDTNDIGTGEIKQTWVLGFEPGMIRWRRPNRAEVIQSNIANATARRMLSHL